MSALFAVFNIQKIHAIDSEVYQAIRALFISNGLALPSTSCPWSSAESLAMMTRIDENKLTGDERPDSQ